MYMVNKIMFYGTYVILLMTTPYYKMPLPLSRPEREENERNELDGSASKFHKHFINDNMIYISTTYIVESKETLHEYRYYLTQFIVRLSFWLKVPSNNVLERGSLLDPPLKPLDTYSYLAQTLTIYCHFTNIYRQHNTFITY